MSLGSIMSTGLSGLQAAQAGLKVVSQNISNVNTPGYVRADLNLTPSSLGSEGAGVAVTSITRAADQFLAAAALNAGSAQGAAGVRADLLDRAQTAFGDPNSDTSLFGALNNTFSSLTALSSDPTNTLRRSAAISSVQTFLNSSSYIAGQLSQLQVETENRLNEQAQSASKLLSQISDLNKQIATTKANGGDTTASENAQGQLIDQLSAYVDVKVTARDTGGVNIRTGPGALLVGENAATIKYTPASSANAPSGTLTLVDANGVSHPLEGLITSGSLVGLIQARDTDLPQLAQSLGALTAATADALNAVHNASSAVPAPTSLTGRNTGLLDTDAMSFTGKSTVAVTDSAGNLLHRIDIDFDAGTLDIDGAGPGSYGGPGANINQFVGALNSALAANGTATFANGVLKISATGANGIVVGQDPTTPSSRAGRGFAQFFGLNDLVTRATPLFFDTGFTGTDAHGLDPGGALAFRVKDSTGRVVADRTVPVTGATWDDEIGALNTSIGSFGTFALSSTGALTTAPANGYTIEFTGDTTSRGATGLSMSQLFGLDRGSSAGRASDLAINGAIAANPARLSLAQADLSQPLGARVLETGDARGALALVQVANANVNIAAGGALGAQTTTLATFASRLGGEAGRRASDADSAQTNAAAVANAATAQRSGVEGVKLDDELVKMTQYQQSYAAASRLIQAAKDMFDVLLSIK